MGKVKQLVLRSIADCNFDLANKATLVTTDSIIERLESVQEHEIAAHLLELESEGLIYKKHDDNKEVWNLTASGIYHEFYDYHNL